VIRMPWDTTVQALEVLETRHVESLAQLELREGLPPGTLERLNVGHLAGEGFRRRHDVPPIALVGAFGSSERPERNKRGGIDVMWTLAVEVTVVGMDRADTLKRRDWYGLTAAEALVHHLPRAGADADALDLLDVDLTAGADPDTSETVAQTRLLFDVKVADVLSLQPYFAEPPADPYTPAPPTRWPVAKVSTTIVKEQP
jgi:hypothetical protein